MAIILLLYLLLHIVVVVNALSGSTNWSSEKLSALSTRAIAATQALSKLFTRTAQRELNIWDMVQITILCGAVPGLWFLHRQIRKNSDAPSWESVKQPNLAIVEDPGESQRLQRRGARY